MTIKTRISENGHWKVSKKIRFLTYKIWILPKVPIVLQRKPWKF